MGYKKGEKDSNPVCINQAGMLEFPPDKKIPH